MNVIDWAFSIFNAKSLPGKLISANLITDFTFKKNNHALIKPSRPGNLDPSDQKIKFPKVAGFHDQKVRAQALSFFANHELEAIEMMCAALIKFGEHVKRDEFQKISRGMISSIKDEQKHLRLYMSRIEDFGCSFGDFPVNDFFWKQFDKLESLSDFFSLMSLTLEAANLDFCLFYEQVFREIGDQQTADIMRLIYNDELKHVKLGVYWLDKWRDDDTLWDYYIKHLPENIGPERSKGIKFSVDSRRSVGLDESYINSLLNFSDSFQISKRKSNKNVF